VVVPIDDPAPAGVPAGVFEGPVCASALSAADRASAAQAGMAIRIAKASAGFFFLIQSSTAARMRAS
jgi:hypothetical protein